MRSVSVPSLPTHPDGLSGVAEMYAKSALAPNTLRTYRAQWKAWDAFARDHDCAALPASATVVANWLAQRASTGQPDGRRADRRGQSVTTLRTAVAALRAAHFAAGLPFDSQHPAIVMVLRGAARLQIDAPQQAAALKRKVLTRILQGLGPSYKDRRDAALLALGYCFALRRSELVGLDLGRLGHGQGVLSLHDNRLEVRLARTKTGPSRDVFVLPRRANRLAIDVIEMWLTVANVRDGEPVLRRVRKSGQVGSTRLDAQSVAMIVKRCADASSLSDGGQSYSGHSLRVGFATSAAEAGADIATIQRALGHRTTTMAARYAQSAYMLRTSPLHLPGAALNSTIRQSRVERPAIQTPSALRRSIKTLPASQPETEKLESCLERRRRRQPTTWYADQREHWLGWLADYDGPGAYRRQSWGRSAAYVYNHVRCAPMLLWLAEASGCPKEAVRRAARRALTQQNEGSQCAAIRSVLAWSTVEKCIRSR